MSNTVFEYCGFCVTPVVSVPCVIIMYQISIIALKNAYIVINNVVLLQTIGGTKSIYIRIHTFSRTKK